jgi:vacuolar-type H+-ATPase subunit F/Vma7
MNICVIGDADIIIGFALTGIKNLYQVKTPEEAWEVYQKDDSKIVIISNELSEVIDKNKEDEKIIVRISKSNKEDKNEDFISNIIREAIGFDIN